MGLVQNLKKTLSSWGDRILVELSCHYIKHLAKQTLKKQDNSSPMGFSLNPLTREDLPTTIATSSQDTSEKTTMMETEDIVRHTRDWAINRIGDMHEDGVTIETIEDAYAICQEFDEWIEPNEDELEVVSIDEITDEEYDDYLERK